MGIFTKNPSKTARSVTGVNRWKSHTRSSEIAHWVAGNRISGRLFIIGSPEFVNGGSGLGLTVTGSLGIVGFNSGSRVFWAHGLPETTTGTVGFQPRPPIMEDRVQRVLGSHGSLGHDFGGSSGSHTRTGHWVVHHRRKPPENSLQPPEIASESHHGEPGLSLFGLGHGSHGLRVFVVRLLGSAGAP
jgi:hypothetical protein